MQISLMQPDIEKAVAMYLKAIGVVASVQTITFKAGRKGAGLSANINLEDTEVTVPSSEIIESILEDNSVSKDVLDEPGNSLFD